MRHKAAIAGLTVILLSLASFITPGLAANPPTWLADAQKAAGQGGYALIRPPELKNLLDSDEGFILLDVRPDYEFRRGHIPGAWNLEFHLGDRNRIPEEKKEKLARLLGPDKERKVVIYCRSFR